MDCRDPLIREQSIEFGTFPPGEARDVAGPANPQSVEPFVTAAKAGRESAR